MSQLMAVFPKSIAEYTVRTEEHEALLEKLIDGDIGSNIKSIMVEQFSPVLDTLFDDFENSRLEALSGYANLLLGLNNISADEMILPKISELYGPVISSNFRFALKMLMALIQILIVTVQQTPSSDIKFPDIDVKKLREDLTKLSVDTEDIPDATSIPRTETDYHSIFADVVMGYNIGLFIILVIVVAALTKRAFELSSDEINQIEMLLRDWPQETMAQISLFGVQKKVDASSFDLQGIVPDSDDYEVLEEGQNKLIPSKE
jgi:hypothetical protein